MNCAFKTAGAARCSSAVTDTERLFMSAVAMAAPAAGGYRLLQTIPVPGDDGWDHPTVDAAARRLYVTHGTHVAVIDIESGQLVGKIDNTPGVHFTVID